MKSILLSGILTTGLAFTVTAQDYQWAKNIGGSSDEWGYSIAVELSGNVYLTGFFEGTADFDPSAGTASLTSAGDGDIFFAKYDINGNYLWAKSVGGANDDNGRSIALDSSGNVYVTGEFWGTVDFDPSASTSNLVSAGLNDVFFAKYDTDGNYLWSKSLGGGGIGGSNSISIDDSGHVYLTGHFVGITDFDPSATTANLTSTGGSQDVFLAKYDTDGNYLWAKSVGGSDNEIGYSIDVDISGNVYLTGEFSGIADFDPSAATVYLASTGSNYGDVFFAKYDNNGNYIWAKSAGGSDGDVGYSMALDAFGNVYLTGFFNDIADFDPSASTTNLTSAGGYDIFFAKYDTDGNYLWAKSAGGVGIGVGNSIAIDVFGNVYLTGYFSDISDFDPSAASANLTSAGGYDVFFAKYDTDGNYLWAKNIGGLNVNYGRSVALDTLGNLYVTGSFQTTADFDPSANTANLTAAGASDIFIAKYSQTSTGINDNNVNNNAIAVYPNLTSSQINFSVQTNVQLSNLTGQIVANEKKVNTLNIIDQPAGIYIVTLTDEKGQVLQRSKIVKE